MMKEILIALYLGVFKLLFSLFKLLPLKNKTVFLSTFGDNAFYIGRELAISSSQPLVFINSPKCKEDFSVIPTDKKIFYSTNTVNLSDFLHAIYHLATSKYVFIDNYVGALAAVQFKKEVKCVQLWHAAGAVKKFGWSDPQTFHRSARAKKRFQKVYNQFQYIPVGSQHMANIFSEAFRLSQKHFLYTGVPQTDFYFDENLKQNALKRVYARYPQLKEKKVILYAPTFRKDGLRRMNMEYDIKLFLDSLDDHHVLLIRIHPSVHETARIPVNPRVLLASDYPQINDLLLASDILVTDYSSIPVEFSLLQRKMIFFTYDLEAYNDTQGLWSMNDLSFPGPVARTTAEVIAHIKDPHIDYNKINRFRDHWNEFSSGASARRLISKVYDPDDL
ncbi:teichoic acid biosynthesis protein B [Planomicrobium sp. Y74]|nr:teichoic acid biosynthesis protein B [Planomicrobium sp. Y74]